MASECASETRRGGAVSDRALWCFLGVGISVALGSLLIPTASARSFVYDALSIAAAAAAVYGILRNDPKRRRVWQLFALALALFAAGDVAFDVAVRGFGRSDGYPYADVLYLLAYPVLAIALVRLARSRFERATLIDSAVVAITLSRSPSVSLSACLSIELASIENRGFSPAKGSGRRPSPALKPAGALVRPPS